MKGLRGLSSGHQQERRVERGWGIYSPGFLPVESSWAGRALPQSHSSWQGTPAHPTLIGAWYLFPLCSLRCQSAWEGWHSLFVPQSVENSHCWKLSSVQSPCCVWLFATPWTAAHQASLTITNLSWLKLMSIESVMPSNHLILCHPLLFPPLVFPSIRVFFNESVLHIRWQKYWSFSFSISPSNDYSGLIFFRMDRLDLFAVQETLKSLLQHHSSKVSILWHSAFFIVQLSHPYVTTGKNIALTRWTFVGKVISLLFNMLYRFVIAFLPRCKHLLVSCPCY